MANFTANLKEVDRLSDIHAIVTPKGPGRKYNVQILHKNSIVMLVACWEAFVEDLAANGLTSLLAKAPNYKVLPDEVLERIANKLQGKKAWSLAGDGWKAASTDHLKDVLARTTGSLNTPKTVQVDELFDKVLGMKSLSSHWHWKGRSAARTKAALDELVTLRGSIAHRVSSAQSVRKQDVSDARELLARLAVTSHNSVNRHLTRLVAEKPWEGYWFSETR